MSDLLGSPWRHRTSGQLAMVSSTERPGPGRDRVTGIFLGGMDELGDPDGQTWSFHDEAELRRDWEPVRRVWVAVEAAVEYDLGLPSSYDPDGPLGARCPRCGALPGVHCWKEFEPGVHLASGSHKERFSAPRDTAAPWDIPSIPVIRELQAGIRDAMTLGGPAGDVEGEGEPPWKWTLSGDWWVLADANGTALLEVEVHGEPAPYVRRVTELAPMLEDRLRAALELAAHLTPFALAHARTLRESSMPTDVAIDEVIRSGHEFLAELDALKAKGGDRG